MGIARKIIRIICKTVACIIITAVLAVCATSFSPVYRFRTPVPFSGPDIYNPYHTLDTSKCWKRANFHTHTRVPGPLNECELWPEDVYKALERFGYDIVTFSNHNRLTQHPFDTALQVNVYEHGYNLFKYHKLVFGCDKVWRFDHLIPFFAFQKQFQLERLRGDSDLVQINHPLRTDGLEGAQMEKLSGYRLIELDSGKSTENRYWDLALSSGHYSFGTANDDLHYPDRSGRIAVRCNFLCCSSASYADIRTALMEGCFYSMRVPDYGHGDWEMKYRKNRTLPFVKDIGLKDSTVFISVSQPADSIKIFGQDHKTLCKVSDADVIEYVMKPADSYARITAWFPEGEVIYSNPFARYDSSLNSTPFNEAAQDINIILTILFNLAVAAATAGCAYMLYKIIRS